MGNAILQAYDVEERPFGCGGLKGMWLLYHAKHKENKEAVTVMLLKKSYLPKAFQNEAFYEFIKREAQVLLRLRHPNVLKVLQPIDESRSAFVVICEPVIGSLANFTFGTVRPSSYVAELDKNEQVNFDTMASSLVLSELDVKNGIRQISECLLFLHTQARMYHCGVEPLNIFLTPQGEWRLGGFYFSHTTTGKGELVEKNPHIVLNGSNIEDLIAPSLDFCSPELMNGRPFNQLADSFSTGILAWHLHRYVSKEHSVKQNTDLISYNSFINMLPSTNMTSGVPASLQDSLRLLVKSNSQERLSIESFLQAEYFRDILIRTLRYLDSILEKDIEGRIEFLKRLPQALSLFDRLTVERRVLPPLLLQLQDVSLALFVLPSVLEIAKQKETTTALFESQILPSLIKLLPLENPPQLTFVFLKSLELLATRCSAAAQRDYIIPMILRAMDSKTPAIAQQALKELSDVNVVNKLEFREFKALILPRLKAVCSAPTTHLSMRVNALICMSKIFTLLDSETITTVVMESVDGAVAAEKSPAILMCALGVYEALGKNNNSVDTLASKILPKLIPMSIEKTLNLSQYKQFSRAITSILSRVDEIRCKDLEQSDFLAKQAQDHNIVTAAASKKFDSDNPLDSLQPMEGFKDFTETSIPKPAVQNIPVPVAAATLNTSAQFEDFFSSFNAPVTNSKNTLDAFLDFGPVDTMKNQVSSSTAPVVMDSGKNSYVTKPAVMNNLDFGFSQASQPVNLVSNNNAPYIMDSSKNSYVTKPAATMNNLDFGFSQTSQPLNSSALVKSFSSKPVSADPFADLVDSGNSRMTVNTGYEMPASKPMEYNKTTGYGNDRPLASKAVLDTYNVSNNAKVVKGVTADPFADLNNSSSNNKSSNSFVTLEPNRSRDEFQSSSSSKGARAGKNVTLADDPFAELVSSKPNANAAVKNSNHSNDMFAGLSQKPANNQSANSQLDDMFGGLTMNSNSGQKQKQKQVSKDIDFF